MYSEWSNDTHNNSKNFEFLKFLINPKPSIPIDILVPFFPNST